MLFRRVLCLVLMVMLLTNSISPNGIDTDDIEGLHGYRGAATTTDPDSGETTTDPGYPREIKVTFWTENDLQWISGAAEGKLPREHWNKVHLVLNGHEADHQAYGVPEKAPRIEKKAKEAGRWTKDGVTLTLYALP